jgi:hypothetical protein
MVLEAVYEKEFLSCSYGFRPGLLQTLSYRHEVLRGTKQVEITIVDAGYYPDGRHPAAVPLIAAEAAAQAASDPQHESARLPAATRSREQLPFRRRSATLYPIRRRSS